MWHYCGKGSSRRLRAVRWMPKQPMQHKCGLCLSLTRGAYRLLQHLYSAVSRLSCIADISIQGIYLNRTNSFAFTG